MDQIKLLLTKSDLTPEQQNELFVILKLLPVIEVDELSNFLAIHPEWIGKLYQNYERKKGAAISKNNKKWQEIFDEEKIELEKL